MREQDAELRRAFAPLRDKALSVSSYVEGRLPGLERPRVRLAAGRLRLLQLSAAAAAGFLMAVAVFQPWRSIEAPRTVSDADRAAISSPSMEAARLEVAAGAVEILPPGTDTWTGLARGDSIARGSRVRTSAVSRCELSTSDGSTVRLNRGTVLAVRDQREFELEHGQVWANVVRGELRFRVAVPAARTAVTALGTRFDVLAELDEALVTVVEGSTRVDGLGPDNVLVEGEVARVVDGRLAERRRTDDLVLATRWVHELLVLKDRDDAELSARVGELFAQIGKTKVSLLLEDEIRSLGDHCVLPLRSYLLSTDSRDARDAREKRALAARILADVTQPWFIPDLIDLLEDGDGEVRYHAARGLERLTQRDQGASAEAWRDGSESARELALARWETWWEENRDRYPRGPARPAPPNVKARALK